MVQKAKFVVWSGFIFSSIAVGGSLSIAFNIPDLEILKASLVQQNPAFEDLYLMEPSLFGFDPETNGGLSTVFTVVCLLIALIFIVIVTGMYFNFLRLLRKNRFALNKSTYKLQVGFWNWVGPSSLITSNSISIFIVDGSNCCFAHSFAFWISMDSEICVIRGFSRRLAHVMRFYRHYLLRQNLSNIFYRSFKEIFFCQCSKNYQNWAFNKILNLLFVIFFWNNKFVN